ncbi:UNVERIFIED_CONTAM: hypothetical protein Cloal_1078 [Acetivibrio alkalicellulosi]
MSWTKNDKFKNYILIILVITSVVQVGVLWYYQNGGMPTNFLWGVFNSPKKQVTIDTGDYIKPYRIRVTEGFENPHWVINENDKHYDSLWYDAKYYIGNILSNKNILAEREFSEEKWEEVIVRKSTVFEFKSNLNSNLMAAFLRVKFYSDFKPSGIYKIAVLPSENINNNANIYIYDGIRVYMYTMHFNKEGLSRSDYDVVISQLYESESDSFEVVKEIFPTSSRSRYNFKPDVLVVAKGNKYRGFRNIIAGIPYDLGNISPDSIDINLISEEVLGSEKDSFIRSIDAHSAIVFKNFSNTYRISRDGMLEYRYLSVLDRNEKGNEIEAFQKAIEFIKKRENLVSGADIYLAGMVEQANFYTFYFDYKINDMSVFVNKYPVVGSNTSVNHGITINANSKRVVNCQWVLRKFEVGQETLDLNVNFGDLLDDTFALYSNLINGNFSIKDKSVSYEISYTLNTQSIKPVWVIETIDNTRYIVPMRER